MTNPQVLLVSGCGDGEDDKDVDAGMVKMVAKMLQDDFHVVRRDRGWLQGWRHWCHILMQGEFHDNARNFKEEKFIHISNMKKS